MTTWRLRLSFCVMQTFSQYLQSLAGASTKQTSLHSTMDNENIVGLYKQQQNDDQFKVGSPSGSVFWTAGKLPGLLPTISYQRFSVIQQSPQFRGPARARAAQDLSAPSANRQAGQCLIAQDSSNHGSILMMLFSSS